MNRFVLAGVVGAAALGVALAQPGGPGGPGGPPGFGQPERKLVAKYDRNADGWLNAEERKAAREEAKKGARGGFGFGGPRGPGGPGGAAGTPGPKINPADVKNYPDASLYDPTVLRTLFFTFENADWETELSDFHGTDVEVPATLTVDGKTYPNVGVHFRGMSSYMGVRPGLKRSFGVSLDLANSKQRLYGHKTLNLLNANGDASLISSALYSHIARQYIPTPKANFVKVVINGESWGIYPNLEQFNKDFLKANYKGTKGARWKVRGSPGGGGGLDYIGENVADYQRRYTIKSKDDPADWQALIHLCKTLSQTPTDQLEKALESILDIDGVLWFLALDNVLMNSDGYWIRASDYSLYRDEKGKFHVIPHDMNECFRPSGGGPGGFGPRPIPGEILPRPLQDMLGLTDAQKKQLAELQKETDAELARVLNAEQRGQLKAMREGGPGGPGGPGGGPRGPGGPGGPGGAMTRGGPMELDPLIGLQDSRKPLRSKLLAVPALRERYLRNVRTLAEKSLDWKTLGPVVAAYRALIEKEVEIDTRKLGTFASFQALTADAPGPATPAPGPGGPGGFGPGRGRGVSLRDFADQRCKYLLANPEVAKRKP